MGTKKNKRKNKNEFVRKKLDIIRLIVNPLLRSLPNMTRLTKIFIFI